MPYSLIGPNLVGLVLLGSEERHDLLPLHEDDHGHDREGAAKSHTSVRDRGLATGIAETRALMAGLETCLSLLGTVWRSRGQPFGTKNLLLPR